MDMSGMDMGTTSSAMHMSAMTTMTSSVNSATSTNMMSMSGMTMGMSNSITTSSSMDMEMSGMSMQMMSTSTSSTATSSTATSTSTMDMSGMDMDSGNDSTMSMTMWMTTKYRDTPVFFRTLDAHSGAAAFGIFCVLFFCSFFFRGLIFLSSYLEQAVFHNYSNTIIVEEDCDCSPDDDKQSPGPSTPAAPPFGEIIRKLFWMGPRELMHDVIRLLLAFTIVMFGYAIMLAAMSFVILYFFAICLGLSFGEIFFNRLSIILNINKSFGACSGLH